jgi:hypothetical protein
MRAKAQPEHHLDVARGSGLHFHTSGFMARVAGSWTEANLAEFRHFLKLRRLSPSTNELLGALELAKEEYFASSAQLYICDERPCRVRLGYDASDRAMATASRQLGLAIRKTGCQGLCKRAPVSSLRLGQRSQVFTEVVTPGDWSAVLTFAEAAARAGSLLVPAGGAERLFHDPVHHHEELGVHLRPLTFLLGRFRGEGKHSANSYTFQKELIGTYEAGGRFIALRMDASYPTPGGGNDVHKALVVVGAEPSSGIITGRAYTDGGITHEYIVRRSEQGVNFSDAPPDHSQGWASARKTLQPTEEGFEERLEVDYGEGFKTYYAISMRRLAAP